MPSNYGKQRAEQAVADALAFVSAFSLRLHQVSCPDTQASEYVT